MAREYGRYNDGRRFFEVHDCGIDICYSEITPEEYEKYSAMTYPELNALIEAELSDAAKYGYGYYGHNLYKDNDGVCFLGKRFGSSCE